MMSLAAAEDIIYWSTVLCRAAFVKQIPGFTEKWYGVKHRIDKFFHGVPVPANASWEKKPAQGEGTCIWSLRWLFNAILS